MAIAADMESAITDQGPRYPLKYPPKPNKNSPKTATQTNTNAHNQLQLATTNSSNGQLMPDLQQDALCPGRAKQPAAKSHAPIIRKGNRAHHFSCHLPWYLKQKGVCV